MESGTSGGQCIKKTKKNNHEVERKVGYGGGEKYIQGCLL
jgi:hypothetical protein